MRCTRCGGLMVRETFEDLGALGSNDYEYAGWRCINCGAIADPGLLHIDASHRGQHRVRRRRRTFVHARISGSGGAASQHGVSR
jgi:hypothetical protein